MKKLLFVNESWSVCGSTAGVRRGRGHGGVIGCVRYTKARSCLCDARSSDKN